MAKRMRLVFEWLKVKAVSMVTISMAAECVNVCRDKLSYLSVSDLLRDVSLRQHHLRTVKCDLQTVREREQESSVIRNLVSFQFIG